jgi:hypothetical protein
LSTDAKIGSQNQLRVSILYLKNISISSHNANIDGLDGSKGHFNFFQLIFNNNAYKQILMCFVKKKICARGMMKGLEEGAI